MKILIIGQAPPAIAQKVPYDTTMLYEWFEAVGINKEQAQELFTFDAIYNKFPGYDSTGGHLKPTNAQVREYYSQELEARIKAHNQIIVLGNPAKSFLVDKLQNKEVLYLIHPSYRNVSIYNKNKNQIISSLKSFINASRVLA